MVYQRRMLVDALQTQAIVAAATVPEKAGEFAEKYFQTIMPVDPDEQALAETLKDLQVQEVANMDPIPLSDIRLPDQPQSQQVQSSMFSGVRPPKRD